jgi:DHA2 family multidrug resistance protein
MATLAERPPAAPLHPSPPSPPPPANVVEYGTRRLIIVVGIMAAALLQTLDATIVNVALPTIEGNIGASIDDGTWIITGYIISNVIAIPLAPYFIQRFGRKQYYATSIIGFTVASFLCGTADSLGMLVFYRVVQGAFGGGLIATSQIILRATFPPEKLGASAALFAIALTAGPALGPTLGGILTDAFSWQWVFEINILPGIVAATIVIAMVRNAVPPRRLPLDAAGVAFLVIALGALQYVLDEGNRADWFDSPRIVAFAVASASGAIAFVVWELVGTRTPIVDLRVFRYRNVAFGVPVSVLLGMVNFGPTVIIPQYVQGVLGFTATLSGFLMLARAFPAVVLTPLVARLAERLDPRTFIVSGCVVSGISFVVLALHMTTGSDADTFWPILVVSGIGQALVFVPLLVSVLGSVTDPADGPKVSSFISLSFQMGGSIASTMLVTVYDRRTYFHSDVLRSVAYAGNPHLPAATPSNVVALARAIAQQASNLGFADAVLALVPFALGALALTIFLRRPRRAAPTPGGRPEIPRTTGSRA